MTRTDMFYIRTIIGSIALLTAAACTDDANTIRTLQAYGFTHIQTTGFEPYACSEDDTFQTGFTARNAQGRTVSGAVCCGMFKNCTVRF